MNNKLKIAIVSATVATISTVSFTPALAASYNDSGQKINFFDRVALMLGFKKNLSPEKKAQRIEEMKQKHESKLSARLDGLVAEGKITESQKTELRQKIDAIEQAKLNSAGQTQQQKKEATKQARDDLKAWAEANGISLGDIMPQKQPGQHHGNTQN